MLFRSLVVGGDLEAGQAQMLGHLGIAPERLLKVDLDRVYRFRQLWVPAQLVDRMRLHPGAIEWMHARIARPGQCVRRMFISRRDAARRRLVNEDEIIEIVSAHGFEIVLPAMLNQVDQARLFTEAASVIGVAGAGLTNMLFAPTGATLIELHNFEKGAEFFRRLCAQRDQRYARVWGELLPAPDIPPNHYEIGRAHV